jgi:pilus assembly protein Flp/PilA
LENRARLSNSVRILSIEPTSTISLGENKMRKFFKVFVRDERGVSAMEYAVLAGIIAVALGTMGSIFSTSVQAMFKTMFTAIGVQQAK